MEKYHLHQQKQCRKNTDRLAPQKDRNILNLSEDNTDRGPKIGSFGRHFTGNRSRKRPREDPPDPPNFARFTLSKDDNLIWEYIYVLDEVQAMNNMCPNCVLIVKNGILNIPECFYLLQTCL
jgi:hypothetical protein